MIVNINAIGGYTTCDFYITQDCIQSSVLALNYAMIGMGSYVFILWMVYVIVLAVKIRGCFGEYNPSNVSSHIVIGYNGNVGQQIAYQQPNQQPNIIDPYKNNVQPNTYYNSNYTA